MNKNNTEQKNDTVNETIILTRTQREELRIQEMDRKNNTINYGTPIGQEALELTRTQINELRNKALKKIEDIRQQQPNLNSHNFTLPKCK